MQRQWQQMMEKLTQPLASRANTLNHAQNDFLCLMDCITKRNLAIKHKGKLVYNLQNIESYLINNW